MVDRKNVFMVLFGETLSQAFHNCEPKTLRQCEEEILSFMPHGRIGFDIDEELNLLLLESKGLCFSKDGRRSKIISDASLTNRILSLYLNPRATLVNGELFSALKNVISSCS